MARVLAIQGSPRRRGNTATVLEHVLAVLRKNGARVKSIDLGLLTLKGCNECFACQKVLDRPGCPIRDDIQDIYGELLKADLIIFATPVFCWGPSAQMKAVFDRCYALFKFSEDPYRCLLEGKRAALVVTAAGDRTDGADLVGDAYRRFIEYARVRNAGAFLACSLSKPEDTARDKRLAARASRFGEKLVTLLSK